MSYDLRLFRPKGGEDPLVTAERGEPWPPPPSTPEKTEVKRRIAKALIAFDPRLEACEYESDLDKDLGMSVSGYQRQDIELNGPEDGSGIQIGLYDDFASISVPYWHGAGEAEAVFREILGYARVACQASGYLLYDPQIGRVFDPLRDFDAAIECYLNTSAKLKAVVATHNPPRRPWWKIW